MSGKSIIKKLGTVSVRRVYQLAVFSRKKINRLTSRFMRIPLYTKLSIGSILLFSIFLIGFQLYKTTWYKLDKNAQRLLTTSFVTPSQLNVTKTGYTFNLEEKNKPGSPSQIVLAGNKFDSTGASPYQVTFNKEASDGVTFADSKKEFSVTLKPQFESLNAKNQDGRVIYPISNDVSQVYTIKRNGIKEDIILSKVPTGGNIIFSWLVETGSKLEARLRDDGSVGIYASDSFLNGDISVGDDKSQVLLDKARKHAPKTSLKFVIPKPYILDSSGYKRTEGVSFQISKNILTLKVMGLKNQAKNARKLSYPISIDPSIVVTSSADFGTGSDSGTIDYSTSGQVTRGGFSPSSANWATNSNYFVTPRAAHSTVAYNGYLYVIGGVRNASSSSCKNSGTHNYCNDIQYAPINKDGSIGTWTTNTTYFSIPRAYQTSVAYNGYMYVIGGQEYLSDANCKNSGSSNVCNDTQYAPINSNGSIGTWTTNTTYFSIPREGHTTVAYNGYLYVMGGEKQFSDSLCKTSGSDNYCSDIQYAPINSGGSIGTWTTNTTYFNYQRAYHASVTYNGYMYVIGGYQGTTDTNCKNTSTNEDKCNDIQYAPIKANGSIGTWTTNTTYFSFPRAYFSSSIYNGYLYVIGGQHYLSDTNCKDAGTDLTCNDVQYAPVNSDGSIGTWTTNTTYFSIPRRFSTAVSYNGYLYILGGSQTVSDTNCKDTGTDYDCNDIQYAPISDNGSVTATNYGAVSTFTTNATYFDFPRTSFSTAVYNNFIYVIGGYQGTANTNCKNTGTSNTMCNDIQYAPFNSDGSIGSWTTNSTYFSSPRTDLTSEVYNGYLYIIGGAKPAAGTACRNSGSSTWCNDTQYALINSDGSIGTFTTNSTYFANPRESHASVVYDGYLYVVGGQINGGQATNIVYAPINSDGSVGTWTTDSTIYSTARSNQAAFAYNGYLYVVGGFTSPSTTSCKDTGGNTQYCNDIQYATINSDHTLGTFITNTNYFSIPRSDNSMSFAYDGFMYVVGGYDEASDTNCKNSGTGNACNDTQYAQINSDGSIGTFTTSTNYFTYPRAFGSYFINKDKLYVMGGQHLASDTNCKNTGTSFNCSDTQYASLLRRMPQTGYYEKIIDTGASNTSLQSIVIDGLSYCPNNSLYTLSYNTASIERSNKFTFGPATQITGLTTGSTVVLPNPTAQYLHLIITIDDQACGTPSSITAITLNYGYAAPNAPDLISPAEGPALNTWNTTSSFTGARERLRAVAYNGYLYLGGGLISGPSYPTEIQYAKIKGDGTISPWSRTSSFTTGRANHTMLEYNGYMYVIGGTNTSNVSLADVQFAPINSDGSLGSWVATTSMTTARDAHTSVAYNGFLYAIGGMNDTTKTNDVEYAPINADGTVGSWASTTAFITARNEHSSVVYKGYLYIVGGWDSSSVYKDDVQYAPLNTDGTITSGAWHYTHSSTDDNTTYVSGIGVARWGHGAIISNGYMYVSGGVHATSDTACNGTSSTMCSDLLYAQINSNGTIGTWNSTVNFNTARRDHAYATSNGYQYIIGGGAGGANDVQVAQSTPSTTLPVFRIVGAQAQSSYLRYKIDLCTDLNCSSVIRQINQTATQTNWTGQDQQTSTAYAANKYPEKSTIGVNTYTAPALNPGTTYYWRAYAIDPAYSNTWSAASYVGGFTTDYAASVPALLSPADGATNAPVLPVFKLAASDPTGDYLRYKIEVCSTNNCSSVVRTIDQTSSQTGWQGQGTQSGTAYTSGTTIGASAVAQHLYQAAALSPGTQYWWRAYSIDPGGSNTFSSASSISTFTTLSNSTSLQLRGTTKLRGGTKLR